MSLYDRFTFLRSGLSPRAQPPALVGYGVAALLVGLSTLLGLWFRPATYSSPYLFFYAAILTSLVYGGFGPGLASTFLSALLVNYLFQPPYGQFSCDLPSLVRGSYFCLSFGFICWLVDTRRQAAEGQIQTQHQLLDMAAAPVIMSDEDNRIIYWNKGAEAVYGWNGQEATGQRITELLHTVLPEPIQDIKSQLTSVGQWSGDLTRTRKDGSAVFVSSSWTLRWTGRHGLTRLESDHDLTEQRKAEERLRASEDQFRTLADFVPQMVWMWTPDGLNIYFNQRWTEYTGMSLEESYGRGWNKPFHNDDKQRAWDAWNHAVATGERYSVESRLQSAEGDYRWFLMQGIPLHDTSGEIVKWFGSCTDVEDMKQAEMALRSSEEQLRMAVQVAAMGVWELQLPAGVVIWSPEALDILGFPAHHPQLSFEEATRFTHPEDRPLVEKQSVLLLAGKPMQVEFRIIRSDNEVRWIEISTKAGFDASGQPVRTVGVIRDVTESHRLEEQFRQAQKMEAVGRLAGGVAHDFNNILGIIIGYGDLLKERIGGDERLRRMIEEILKAANRAASLTHQLLAFSRKQLLIPKMLDLNSVLADLGKMLPRLIGEDIDLNMILGEGLGRVMADAAQIQQVVMNLVVNARDAMPDGGRLTIETANAERAEVSVEMSGIEAKPGAFVLLSVADNGIGMDRATRAHLFEPFFTTKGVDKGTGLGLSIVYGVVKQSGGFIWVDSEPGRGTTFKIYLPRIEAEETSTSTINAPPKSRRGSETILLVEDEQALREAISQFLRAQGYTVLEAHNPSIAIEIADKLDDRIHLLMTDIIMPEMNGQELAKRLTATRPEMGVLYISGYTDRGLTDGTKIDANTNFLQKPFGLDVLGRKLHDILER